MDKEILKILMMAWILGAVLAFAYVFVLAYLSPDKSVTIYINNYGEADSEMFIAIPLAVISCFYLIVDKFREELK